MNTEARLEGRPGLPAPPSARSRFSLNVSSNVAFVVTFTIVMAAFVPFLVRNLGVAAYGVVSLANSLVIYMSLVTESFDVAVNRHLTIDMHRGDLNAANRTFNTAFFSALALAAALTPLVLIGSWLFPRIFSVPPGDALGASLVFISVTMFALVDFVGGAFEVSTFAMHRFDLRNLVKGVSLALRVAVIVGLFAVFGAGLWQVAAGFVVGGTATFVGGYVVARRLTPQLRLRRRSFDRSLLKPLASLSGWSIVNRVGLLLFLGIDLVIVNLLIGASATGRYGALILFPELLRGLSDTVASVINPAMVSHYARGRSEDLRRLANHSVKLIGLMIALPAGLACGMAGPFLRLWLGPTFAASGPLLVLLVAHLSVNVPTQPLSWVLTSYNKVRLQGIVTLALGVGNVILAVFFVKVVHLGAPGVALATAIVYTVRNGVFVSAYGARTLGQPRGNYYPMLLSGAAHCGAVAVASYFIVHMFGAGSWGSLVAAGAIVAVLYAAFVVRLSLTADERDAIGTLLPSVAARVWLRLCPKKQTAAAEPRSTP